MEQPDRKFLELLCHSLAKATSGAVRLYREEECVYFYSVYHLHPDPVTPYLSQILADSHRAGVFTTPLYQFYGFLSTAGGWRIIIGPSHIQNTNARLIDELLFRIGVSKEEKEDYLRLLNCCPVISAERMGWMMVFLAMAVEHREFPMEALSLNIKPEDHSAAVQSHYIDTQEPEAIQEETQELLDQGYQFEKLLVSYIQQGEPERIRQLLNARPRMKVGELSKDSRRQLKNLGICVATVASRAAIAGGLDSRTAFRMSDLYIQQIELMEDIPSLEKLRNDISIDYAEEVRRIRYRVAPGEKSSAADLFAACAEYVSQNIYQPIRVEDMAQALGYTRSYLSSRFKQQTGINLSQYILQEKVFEAQRMLEFTDKSLPEIADLLAFSSQSHFQGVFKRVTGQTPLSYRKHAK